MFHSFLSDDIQQDSATNIPHNKHIIELLKQHNTLSNMLSKIWENTDGFDEHHRCDTQLYLMSMLSQAFLLLLPWYQCIRILHRGFIKPKCYIQNIYLTPYVHCTTTWY